MSFDATQLMSHSLYSLSSWNTILAQVLALKIDALALSRQLYSARLMHFAISAIWHFLDLGCDLIATLFPTINLTLFKYEAFACVPETAWYCAGGQGLSLDRDWLKSHVRCAHRVYLLWRWEARNIFLSPQVLSPWLLSHLWDVGDF